MRLGGLAALTLGAIVLLSNRLGHLPPLGMLLSPAHGFWQNAGAKERDSPEVLRIAGLQDRVVVQHDDRGVPHIFAANDGDLSLAQGYVTARDRLWQMETQARATSGRLSEIIGPRMLGADRYQRRIGMVEAAESALNGARTSPETRLALEAYARGVNAYIGQLDARERPLEYKLLDYAPEDWTELKSALVVKMMAWMLSSRNADLQMSNARERLGAAVVADLFPVFPADLEPIIPRGTTWPWVLTGPSPSHPRDGSSAHGAESDDARGSNNWAISGDRTASGYPILANDPHLSLSLPAVWYEIQLVSPSVNVYGVSLPGIPGVVIGHNGDIAWGMTNGAADVVDWYEIEFRDERRLEYRHGETWRPVRRVVEEIAVRGQETVWDTVSYTHHGPVVWDEAYRPSDRRVPELHALRWLGHDQSNEFLTFYKLNRAANYDEFVEALVPFTCPAHNFAYADRHGDIALWHNGRFPLRREGREDVLCNGADPSDDWQAWIPHEHNPHVRNSQRGYVSSANQHPTDSSYPYPMPGAYVPSYRGRRINQRLDQMDNVTPGDIQGLQCDTRNLHAESVLPALLASMDRRALSGEEMTILEELERWDYHADPGKIGPSVFDAWWRRLHRAIWDDDLGGDGANLPYPGKARTVRMILEDPGARWFDRAETEPEETLAELLTSSFKATCGSLAKELGPVGEAWMWGRYNGAQVRHLLDIPALSREGLFVGGGGDVINATRGGVGPSWRMVVALGPEVRAWGIYPGGQSGNPGSPHYDDFVETWVRGELDELLYMRTADDGQGRVRRKLTLEAP